MLCIHIYIHTHTETHIYIYKYIYIYIHTHTHTHTQTHTWHRKDFMHEWIKPNTDKLSMYTLNRNESALGEKKIHKHNIVRELKWTSNSFTHNYLARVNWMFTMFQTLHQVLLQILWWIITKPRQVECYLTFTGEETSLAGFSKIT